MKYWDLKINMTLKKKVILILNLHYWILLMCFLFKVIYSLNTDYLQPSIKNEFLCNS